ncbi:LysE/ArgO family amino acid transporter [Qingshengfaniella alkalisoli]|uniref:Amino acid transporter n=1 Tax=Qingshengfaniella alkalisoli TaxID=2599296 RepID=A0A5B8ITT5_9RHOB|nr:LysE/ArgO family amino acid transporter [Qingshengfaniella alkalisoli]QDY69024.1 amino acid transporter [Qingshengfaniella alkalisoli]
MMSAVAAGPAVTGLATGFSLILAIGAQNAFVLRQGLLRSHVFSLCLFCALSDALLIAGGVAGFGLIAKRLTWFPTVMSLAGAAFLLVYGAMKLREAWRGDYAMVLAGVSPTLWKTIAIAAAFTWLNPHVYLDTLGLIGAISTRYADTADKLRFGAGAVTASFVFFFSLGYASRFLAPIMQSAQAWRVLDLLIAVVMWSLAVALIGGL